MPNVDVFDKKVFNPQAFGAYIQSLPKERENALLNANIYESDSDIKDMFAHQTTTAYGVIPVTGNFEGKSQNYDGETDLEGEGLDTYYYGVHSYGRAIVGTEKDFTKDLIPGLDPLDQIANKFSDRWDDINEDTIVAILNGIFSSTNKGAKEFAKEHTYEVGADETIETTIYDATQKACGDKNKKFTLAIMHSKQATELAKKQLLEYVKYTDERGIQRNTNIAQWGDKTVFVDDAYTYDAEGQKYITYVLGTGLFKREPLPVDIPFERDRQALKAGGTTNIISRERRVVHPFGFSYLKTSQATKSPTDEEFANGENWDLMQNSDKTKYFPHKLIPVCKIVTAVLPS